MVLGIGLGDALRPTVVFKITTRTVALVLGAREVELANLTNGLVNGFFEFFNLLLFYDEVLYAWFVFTMGSFNKVELSILNFG